MNFALCVLSNENIDIENHKIKQGICHKIDINTTENTNDILSYY